MVTCRLRSLLGVHHLQEAPPLPDPAHPPPDPPAGPGEEGVGAGVAAAHPHSAPLPEEGSRLPWAGSPAE